jgi:alkylated DNA repair protein (DNA oxidative demethylase)
MDGTLPEGFRYVSEFISIQEEQELLRRMEALTFDEVKMRNMVAKRKTLHFGWRYGYESWTITPGRPMPDWLVPLRERVSAFMEEPAERIEEVLLSQYPPGAGIGWHRDAPMFGPKVVGVSLGGVCRFRFQRRRGEIRETSEHRLEPRSAYLITGQARTLWQHSIPPTKALRYSITFRTVKGPRGLLSAWSS